MPTDRDGEAPAAPLQRGADCSQGAEPGAQPAELDQLRSDNRALATKLATAQRAIAELNSVMEESMARSNGLVLEVESSNLVLEEIFNVSHDAIWVLDRNFKIVRANKKMADLVGQGRQDLVGRRCCDLLSLPLCGTADCVLRRLLDQSHSEPVLIDVEARFDERDTLSCILSASPCRDPCGEVFGIVEAFTDITARRQAESALQRANEELARLSRTDGLTGLANRRHFDEVLRAEWLRLRREKQYLSLLLTDVDFFKRFNDTYGHQSGDHCLQGVAQAIRRQLKRPTDVAARYGGEEFAVILPNTHPGGAFHIAELVREEVERLGLPHDASSVAGHVTISIGVASVVPGEAATPEDLIKRADEALYQAKADGRNRSVAYTTDPG